MQSFSVFSSGFFSSEFFVTQISQMMQIFFIGDFFHRISRNLFGGFLLRRLLTDFRGCDLSGRCRYPLRLEKVPQISQIYTDFSWDVFLSRRFRRWRRFFLMGFFFRGFFIHRISRIFADATCPVVADTPWDWTKSHRFHRFTQILDLFGLWKKHADFADDAVFLFGYLGNFTFDYGKNESV